MEFAGEPGRRNGTGVLAIDFVLLCRTLGDSKIQHRTLQTSSPRPSSSSSSPPPSSASSISASSLVGLGGRPRANHIPNWAFVGRPPSAPHLSLVAFSPSDQRPQIRYHPPTHEPRNSPVAPLPAAASLCCDRRASACPNLAVCRPIPTSAAASSNGWPTEGLLNSDPSPPWRRMRDPQELPRII
jgi:hypothetical protein